MRKTLLPLPLLLILFSLSACNTTPLERYAATNEAVIAAIKSVDALHTDGKISDSTWKNKVLPLVNFVNVKMREYKSLVDAGMDATAIDNVINGAIIELEIVMKKDD